jgi:uncharacterized spore protein YtfJ
LQTTATVKTVFGEPIREKDKMIIPVAKVYYGFGAGRGRQANAEDHEAGSGIGGGVAVRPAGVIEITQQGTRFVPMNGRRVRRALLLGIGFGLLMAAACCRRGRRD